jgi:hypothetical protein
MRWSWLVVVLALAVVRLGPARELPFNTTDISSSGADVEDGSGELLPAGRGLHQTSDQCNLVIDGCARCYQRRAGTTTRTYCSKCSIGYQLKNSYRSCCESKGWICYRCIEAPFTCLVAHARSSGAAMFGAELALGVTGQVIGLKFRRWHDHLVQRAECLRSYLDCVKRQFAYSTRARHNLCYPSALLPH